MSLKDLIFQKGGIGVSMSRQETVERLNPLIEKHMALNHAYNDAIAHSTEDEITEALAALQKVARVDVGKLMETVFSCGGVAFNGVGMEPGDYVLSEEDDEMLFQLRNLEQTYQDTLSDEFALAHQIRTKAVLTLLQNNSKQRLDFLKINTKRRRRRTP